MKKNGFTLVEMMTVVVILVLLGLLAIFSINGIVKHSSDELYELQISNVIDAARTYAIAKSSELSDSNQITLCDLKRAGLIEIDFVNPKTEERFDESLIIDINKSAIGEYDVTFDVTKKMENYYCNLDGMLVTLVGNSPYYASLGDSYHDFGVKVQKEENGLLVEHDSYSVEIEGDYRGSLINGFFSKAGTFTQTYIVKETTTQFRTSITRTIIVEDNTAPTISLIKPVNGSCSIDEAARVNYGNSIVIVAGERLTYPCCFSTEGTCKITDNFNNSSKPGTYEIIYTATDAAKNTATKVLTVTVREKNKSLLGKVIVDTFDWTNTGVNLAIEPLYNGTSCNDYLYSFDAGNNWQVDNTKMVTTNGIYKIGIKYNPNSCSSSAEDIFAYKVDNVDIEGPLLTNASVLVKDNNEQLKTAETKYETLNGELIEHKYYYANSSLTISEPSGATDSLSGIGINGYTIFINGVAQDVSEVSLTDEGRYVVELKAVDRAGNESDKKEVAVIIIDKTAPICTFNRCNTISICRNNPVITGTNVTYDAANGRYKVAMSSTTELANFKLTCTDTYYEMENDYLKNTEIDLTNFKVQNESSTIGASTIASSQFISSEANCNSGICTRNYNYVIGVNIGEASTYNSDPVYLRILAGAVSDKAGNSNVKNDSMFLAKSK